MKPKPVTTTVSTKGQVILPSAIRAQKRWAAGTTLVVENTPDGVLLKAAPIFPPTTVDQVFGSARYSGPPKSLKEMDAAVADEARRSYTHGNYDRD